jgi:ionotropic glutamate receptor
MGMASAQVSAILLYVCIIAGGAIADSQNSTNDISRPTEVRIGALFTFDSVIGRAVKPAIELAVADVNADPSVLSGTKLNVLMQDTNCSGFVGTIEGSYFLLFIIFSFQKAVLFSIEVGHMFLSLVTRHKISFGELFGMV